MKSYVLLLMAIVLLSCEPEKSNDKELTLDKLNGFVQKGPYLNGTALILSELSGDFSATGRTFNAQILDNKGTFEVYNIDLASPFVEVKADGYYYNEVTNENSSSQLTLFALSDLTDRTSLNINILSHLERSRVLYLIHNGKTFNEAKKQAQSEILKIFEIEKPDMSSSESLDITKEGEDNAILLAISVILQGYLSVSDLSELIANISTDIREDGILNSSSIGTQLINNARNIDAGVIRANLENRYEALGMNTAVPDFESYIQNFIENSDFEYTAFITYPASGANGLNLLDTTNTISFSTQGIFSLAAILPEGSNLKVKIVGSSWFFPAFQENTGWTYGDWNSEEKSRIFTSTQTGEIDYRIFLENAYVVNCDSVTQICDTTYESINTTIYVYENDDTEPTWSRVIHHKE
ncbi:MAG TPA: hypothetical protein VK179_06800 [Bacteroidales bacterium]|nr:hypothetical protein [Bacteroidales bacterium]